MEILSTLLGLTLLQIVLNIDNVIFVSVLTGSLPEKVKSKARRWSLYISIALSVLMVMCAGYLAILDHTVFSAFGHDFTWKSFIMVGGGLFLMYKSAKEIYEKVEGKHENKALANQAFSKIIMTLAFINFIFSIDSTIAAIGMTNIRWIQMVSVAVAIGTIYAFFNPINRFLEKHPSFKIQAISFLSLIGFSLMTDGLGLEIPKGYIYFAMTISFIFELIQVKIDKVKYVK